MPVTVLAASDLFVQKVAIRRGLEGPQLILTWEPPKDLTDVFKIVVVRRKYDFPATPVEGGGQTVVFDSSALAGSEQNPEGLGVGDPGFNTDIAPEIEPCKCYYYTLFTILNDGSVFYGPPTQIAELAIQTGFFARKLFAQLPDHYVIGDKKQNELEQGKLALTKAFDTTTKEFFNLVEDGLTLRGQLQRFLRVVALELDIVKGLIDCMPTQFDVDEACCEVLEAMAVLVGLQINKELPCARQRQEIKSQVAIYKIKGTKAAIEAQGRLISGVPTRVKEWCGNILLTNRKDRTTLAVPNPGFFTRFGLVDDDTDYTPGPMHGFYRLCVFFFLDCDDCISDRVVAKLNRVLIGDLPVCRIGHLIFIDCTFVEEYDRDRLLEEMRDIMEDRPAPEDYRTLCWLITNRLPGPVSLYDEGEYEEAEYDLGPETGDEECVYDDFIYDLPCRDPFARNSTNSLESVTASRQRVCVEHWHDAIGDEAAEDLTDCLLITNRIERITNSLRWRTPGTGINLCFYDEAVYEDACETAGRCMPLDLYRDQWMREFEERVSCGATHLALLSNDLTSETNTLQSLVVPCAVGQDFAFDVEEGEMIATGTFVGDGTNDRSIVTGLANPVRHLSIWRVNGTDQPVMKVDTMTGKQVKSAGGQTFNGVAFTGNNFTVDNHPALNEGPVPGPAGVYHWVAIG